MLQAVWVDEAEVTRVIYDLMDADCAPMVTVRSPADDEESVESIESGEANSAMQRAEIPTEVVDIGAMVTRLVGSHDTCSVDERMFIAYLPLHEHLQLQCLAQ